MGLGGIVAHLGPFWIHGKATLGKLLIVVGVVEVVAPLPDVSSHIVEAIAIRWIALNGRRAIIAIGLAAFVGKFAMPDICLGGFFRKFVVTPGVENVLFAAVGSIFP